MLGAKSSPRQAALCALDVYYTDPTTARVRPRAFTRHRSPRVHRHRSPRSCKESRAKFAYLARRPVLTLMWCRAERLRVWHDSPELRRAGSLTSRVLNEPAQGLVEAMVQEEMEVQKKWRKRQRRRRATLARACGGRTARCHVSEGRRTSRQRPLGTRITVLRCTWCYLRRECDPPGRPRN
jgi:hypothetical protein